MSKRCVVRKKPLTRDGTDEGRCMLEQMLFGVGPILQVVGIVDNATTDDRAV